MAAISACTHPLDIDGQGQIRSSSGLRDCSPNQAPCNHVVTGDYAEIYEAIADKGYKFKQWEGCDYVADMIYSYSNVCEFNAPASIVDQFWFKSAGTLTAVFEPVDPPTVYNGSSFDTGVGVSNYLSASYTVDSYQDLTFEWEITQAPAGSSLLGQKHSEEYWSMSPDVIGNYTATLTVSNLGGSASGTYPFTASNEAPRLYIYDTFITSKKNKNTEVSISIYDRENNALAPAWELIEGPQNADLDGSFVGFGGRFQLRASEAGKYKVRLTVTDSFQESDSADLTLYVYEANYVTEKLPVQIRDAVYLKASYELVILGEDNRLYFYDTHTLTQQAQLELDETAIKLVTSPNGGQLAVLHPTRVSIIDPIDKSINKSPALPKSYGDLAITDNGIAFLFAEDSNSIESFDFNSNIHSVFDVENFDIYSLTYTTIFISPDNNRLYLNTNYEQIMFDISNNIIDSNYRTGESICSPLRLSYEGRRIFDACGKIFTTSLTPSLDFTPAGVLQLDETTGSINLTGLSSSNSEIMGLLDGYGTLNELILTWQYNGLELLKSNKLPTLGSSSQPINLENKFVFHVNDYSSHTILAQTEQNYLNKTTETYLAYLADQISPPNRPPEIVVAGDTLIQSGESTTLFAEQSYDVDGDTISFEWSVVEAPAGSNLALDNANNHSVSFTPDMPGAYLIRLVLSDGIDDTVKNIKLNATDPSLTKTTALDGLHHAFVYSKQIDQVLALSANAHSLAIINPRTRTTSYLPLSGLGTALALSKSGNSAYVAQAGGTISVVDILNQSILQSIVTGQQILGLLVLSDTTLVYFYEVENQFGNRYLDADYVNVNNGISGGINLSNNYNLYFSTSTGVRQQFVHSMVAGEGYIRAYAGYLILQELESGEVIVPGTTHNDGSIYGEQVSSDGQFAINYDYQVLVFNNQNSTSRNIGAITFDAASTERATAISGYQNQLAVALYQPLDYQDPSVFAKSLNIIEKNSLTIIGKFPYPTAEVGSKTVSPNALEVFHSEDGDSLISVLQLPASSGLLNTQSVWLIEGISIPE